MVTGARQLLLQIDRRESQPIPAGQFEFFVPDLTVYGDGSAYVVQDQRRSGLVTVDRAQLPPVEVRAAADTLKQAGLIDGEPDFGRPVVFDAPCCRSTSA